MRGLINLLRSLVLWTVFFLGLLVVAFIYQLSKVFPGTHEKLFQCLNRIVLSLALRLSGTRVEISGIENIPDKGGFIIAANHSSFLDNIVLIGRLPLLFKIVAGGAGFTLPFIRSVYRGAGYIKAGRRMNLADIASLYKALKKDERVLIYSHVGGEKGPGRFSEAMINFSRQSGVPILPVCLVGTAQVMPMKVFILRNGKILMRIGAPIFTPDLNLLQEKIQDLYRSGR
ncbi:MAG TPA: 1-acyl-sn-glycerol-3-phosphate acyltransferase [Candidatus Omnitrophota bacterium]|nr:1-acyl-sn-glycerol-3-phosphate acyltransferase [Candidatus Omnitrophota bacterium]